MVALSICPSGNGRRTLVKGMAEWGMMRAEYLLLRFDSCELRSSCSDVIL